MLVGPKKVNRNTGGGEEKRLVLIKLGRGKEKYMESKKA